MRAGTGGGVMLREKEVKTKNPDTGEEEVEMKYYAVTGTKGWRWMEAEMVETLDKLESVEREYYEEFVSDAIETIGKFGDWEEFIYGDSQTLIGSEDMPPWLPPCGRDRECETCSLRGTCGFLHPPCGNDISCGECSLKDQCVMYDRMLKEDLVRNDSELSKHNWVAKDIDGKEFDIEPMDYGLDGFNKTNAERELYGNKPVTMEEYLELESENTKPK